MGVDLVIRSGKVVTPDGVVAGGVAVDGETIVAIGADATLPPGRRIVDAQEQYVLPGLIDAHVHMATFKGMATTTIVRGRVMMEGGETVDKPGWGRYVPRGPAARGGTR